MKSIRIKILVVIASVFSSALHVLAIDGLRLSVQSSNVILSWPSVEGETYVVQYRQTLNPTDSWQTIAPSVSAAVGTNFTSYTDNGVVQYPLVLDSGTNGGGDFSPPSPDGLTSDTSGSTATTASG